jgi:hypothetical protein
MYSKVRPHPVVQTRSPIAVESLTPRFVPFPCHPELGTGESSTRSSADPPSETSPLATRWLGSSSRSEQMRSPSTRLASRNGKRRKPTSTPSVAMRSTQRVGPPLPCQIHVVELEAAVLTVPSRLVPSFDLFDRGSCRHQGLTRLHRLRGGRAHPHSKGQLYLGWGRSARTLSFSCEQTRLTWLALTPQRFLFVPQRTSS